MDLEEGWSGPRPLLVETIGEVASAWARRSTCPRARVGSVAYDARGFVIASGFNGAPAGLPHCDQVGCLMDGGHCVRTIHAEANMIITAARYGVSLEGANIYSTIRPCLRCTTMLIQVGVASIVFENQYDTDDAQAMRELCSQAKLRVVSTEAAGVRA